MAPALPHSSSYNMPLYELGTAIGVGSTSVVVEAQAPAFLQLAADGAEAGAESRSARASGGGAARRAASARREAGYADDVDDLRSER